MGRNSRDQYHQYKQIRDLILEQGEAACADGLSPQEVLDLIIEARPKLWATMRNNQKGERSDYAKTIAVTLKTHSVPIASRPFYAEPPFLKLSGRREALRYTLKPEIWDRHHQEQAAIKTTTRPERHQARRLERSKQRQAFAAVIEGSQGKLNQGDHSNLPAKTGFLARGEPLATYTLDYIRTAGLPFAMQYLLPHVRWQLPITYGEVALKLAGDLGINGRIFSTQIGGVCGALMDRLHEMDPAIPLINVLVVRGGKAKLPSSGVDHYLWERFGPNRSRVGPIEPKRRRAMLLKATDEVYAYQHWDRDYQKLFGKTLPAAAKTALPVGTEQDGKTRRGGGFRAEPESAEHKALKAYVLGHPNLVGIGNEPPTRKLEFLLLSYDKVDVMFQDQTQTYLVEVKSSRSNAVDLARGVYQCIKYRAVYSAQCAELHPSMTITPILVTELALPARLQALAKKNGVRTVMISRSLPVP